MQFTRSAVKKLRDTDILDQLIWRCLLSSFLSPCSFWDRFFFSWFCYLKQRMHVVGKCQQFFFSLRFILHSFSMPSNQKWKQIPCTFIHTFTDKYSIRLSILCWIFFEQLLLFWGWKFLCTLHLFKVTVPKKPTQYENRLETFFCYPFHWECLHKRWMFSKKHRSKRMMLLAYVSDSWNKRRTKCANRFPVDV